MNIHISEVYSFDMLDEEIKSKIYSQFESIRFRDIQSVYVSYFKLNIHERINNKHLFKHLVRLSSNFYFNINLDCLSNMYLKDGYILNTRLVKIII